MIWRWIANLVIPSWTLRLKPPFVFHGSDKLLRRFLENGALS